jgi:hypothetical protein
MIQDRSAPRKPFRYIIANTDTLHRVREIDHRLLSQSPSDAPPPRDTLNERRPRIVPLQICPLNPDHEHIVAEQRK